MEEFKSFNDNYRKSGWISKLLFLWCSPIIAYVYKTKNLEDACQCMEMSDSESTHNLTSKIIFHLNAMLDSGNFDYKWSMVKLIYRAFKFDIIVIVVLGALVETVTITTVFMTSYFVEWIKEPGTETVVGILYVLFIGSLLMTSLLFRHRFFFYGKTTGINIKKAISGMIYKKCLRFSK